MRLHCSIKQEACNYRLPHDGPPSWFTTTTKQRPQPSTLRAVLATDAKTEMKALMTKSKEVTSSKTRQQTAISNKAKINSLIF